MSRRLVERFRPGEKVMIRFRDTGDTWIPARVIEPAHPGLWVQTDDKRMWYVTNGRRIKAATESP